MESDVTVREVITREYVGVSESDTVQATVELMRSEQASSVLVLRGNEPVGILTEYDVLEVVASGEDPGETPVSAVMSSPVESVSADVPLTDAAGMMSGENIRNLLVEASETGEVLGVLTDRDIIAAVASLQRTARRGGDAGLPSESARSAGGTERKSGVDTTASTVTNEAVANEATYVTQGVCEECGSLSETLYDTNGQLVCPDCRGV
jgi:CBS domain-containing protein